MKHILNNISEEEKNAIREQHTGGMKLNTKKFKQLLETKQGDVKPLLTESNANKSQINENVASSFKLGMDAVKDPTVKKVLNGKIIDFLRAVLDFIVLFLGEPSGSDYEAYEKDKEERGNEFMQLINPCKNVTRDEIMAVIKNPEFQKFFMDLKKKLQ
jgi:hypothetical protein